MMNWIKEAIIYHIYTLGFCGAEPNNAPTLETQSRIKKVVDWIPHLKRLGVNTILFAPLFESESHGYDTIDYYKLDKRLGTNEDFKEVCNILHQEGFRILLDGVFNHVGRGFFAFKDLQENGYNSQYKDWFVNVHFNGSSPLGDPFYYEGWEGHYELVKLNVHNEAVRAYLFGAVKEWIEQYHIDGLRLDVAYCIDHHFLRALRQFVDSQKEDFWLMGEMIHGDYHTLIQPDLLHSTTNYECYKGIYSSHNDKNYFEINHSLNRLFSHGGLYEGEMLYNFVDNHDVVRIGTILKEKQHLCNVYTLLFTMPGVPSIYYGSEWAIEGGKRHGDHELRPCLELNEMLQRDQGLNDYINKLIRIRKAYEPLKQGGYEQVLVRNEQLIFARAFGEERIYIALNLASNACTLDFGVRAGSEWVNILNETEIYTERSGRLYLSIEPFENKIFVERSKVKALPEPSEEQPIVTIAQEEPEKEVEQEPVHIDEKQDVTIKVTIQEEPKLKIEIEVEDNPMVIPHIQVTEKGKRRD